MKEWMREVWQTFRYRITHTSKFPKGDLTAFLLNLARRGFEPTHIVDVGANRGKWSSKARKVFPHCAFTLVEPQIEMKEHLERFCKGSQGSRWIHAGAGADLGRRELTVVPDTVSSSFTISEEDAQAQNYERRSVSIITLDHLVTNVIHTIPELVKVDAEGSEFDVMKGAQSLIGKTELFLLEAPLIDPPPNWRSFHELLTMMSDFGYVPYDFTTFQKRPFDGAVGLCEIAFARRSGVLRSFAGWDEPSRRAA